LRRASCRWCVVVLRLRFAGPAWRNHNLGMRLLRLGDVELRDVFVVEVENVASVIDLGRRLAVQEFVQGDLPADILL